MTKLKSEEQDFLFYFSPRNWFFIILAALICVAIYSNQKKNTDRYVTPASILHTVFR